MRLGRTVWLPLAASITAKTVSMSRRIAAFLRKRCNRIFPFSAAVVALLLLPGCSGPKAGLSSSRSGSRPSDRVTVPNSLGRGCPGERPLVSAQVTRRSIGRRWKGVDLTSQVSRAAAEGLYRSACRLLMLPETTRPTTCPADFDVYYHLSFFRLGGRSSEMTLDASGCRTLAWGAGPTQTILGQYVGAAGGHSVNLEYYGYHLPALTNVFIADLASVTGIAASEVFIHAGR